MKKQVSGSSFDCTVISGTVCLLFWLTQESANAPISWNSRNECRSRGTLLICNLLKPLCDSDFHLGENDLLMLVGLTEGCVLQVLLNCKLSYFSRQCLQWVHSKSWIYTFLRTHELYPYFIPFPSLYSFFQIKFLNTFNYWLESSKKFSFCVERSYVIQH